MKDISIMAAKLMAASMRTAPKAGGKDFLEIAVGIREFNAAGYDCGACGYSSCKEFIKDRKEVDKEMGYGGPHCVMRMIDLGCALASAAKTANILNIDNRVQQRVGAAARTLGLIKADVVMGIPVGIYGKSIFYDRQIPTVK
jgi:uncharacterized ferredoxin-like protein